MTPSAKSPTDSRKRRIPAETQATCRIDFGHAARVRIKFVSCSNVAAKTSTFGAAWFKSSINATVLSASSANRRRTGFRRAPALWRTPAATLDANVPFGELKRRYSSAALSFPAIHCGNFSRYRLAGLKVLTIQFEFG